MSRKNNRQLWEGSSDGEETEEPTVDETKGYLDNLTEEERLELERKKEQIAAKEAAKSRMKAIERAKEASKTKRQELASKRAWVKGFQLAEQNRISEDNEGWLVCEVCNKKFADFDMLDPHINSAKHKSNLEYYSKHPIPVGRDAASAWDSTGELPEHVTYDEEEMMYTCTLCNKKAASDIVLQGHLEGKEHKKRLDNLEWYAAEQSKRASPDGLAETSDQLPACVEWLESEERYICRWCEKRGDGVEQIVIHLSSKEHMKKCANLGIPQYGESGHMQKVQEFTDKYGFDVWARFAEWPSFITDSATCWNCTMCNKGYITQAQVNEHLRERHSEASQEFVARRSASSSAKPRAPVVSVAAPWAGKKIMCELCHITFGSEAELRNHEANDRTHKLVVDRLEAPLIDI